jgi:hypothetical protein
MKHDVQLITPTEGDPINALLSDFRWLVTEGEPLVLEYSFFGYNSEFYVDARYGYDENNADYDLPFRQEFRPFSNADRALVDSIFSDLEDLLNIDFVEVSDSLDSEIRFGYTDLSREDADGLSFFPTAQFFPFDEDPTVPHETSDLSGDIWIDAGIDRRSLPTTLVHEVGHALGLSHSFESGFEVLEDVPALQLGAELDYVGRTAMAYRFAPSTIADSALLSVGTANTFMPLDIEALQYLYGAAAPVESDDVYILRQFPAQEVDIEAYGYSDFEVHNYLNGYVAITDTGGYNALVIPLNSGVDVDLSSSWNFTGAGYATADYDDPNLHFGAGTLWRDIVTGDGADRVTANDFSNQIVTNDGPDVVYGGAGDDTASLGADNDKYYYSMGNDYVDGGSGIDVVFLGDLKYSHFKFFVYGDDLAISAINGPLEITLENVERVVFSDRQLSTGSFQADIALANRSFILDDDVPLYLSDIGRDEVKVEADDAQLYRLYYGGLGRAPDRGGFEFWQERLDSGLFDFTEIADRFMDSPEFSGLADVNEDGEVSNAEFLDHMYFNVFGREPDAGGYNWWLEQLDEEEILQQEAFFDMVQSDEFVLLTAATVNEFLFV